MEFLELNTSLVPAVRTRQKVGTSANSFRSYEKVPPVRKLLMVTRDSWIQCSVENDLCVHCEHTLG